MSDAPRSNLPPLELLCDRCRIELGEVETDDLPEVSHTYSKLYGWERLCRKCMTHLHESVERQF